MKKRCIIHYKGLFNYSNLKQLRKTNKERIFLAKTEREKLGDKYYHRDQCDGVPESYGENDYTHLEPCCKRFTFILAGRSSHPGPSVEER